MDIPQLQSFFMAGFECTYAKAEEGRRFDLLRASKHDEYVREDYALLRSELNATTVREGFSWSQIDLGDGSYDFSRFEPMLQAASEYGIQQMWDLNHFDFPDRLDPFSDAFPRAYGEYAKRCLEMIRKFHHGTLFITPMNEPSFFAWMCDNGLWAPYAKGKGTELKRQLIKAAITAMDAIWAEDSDIQFVHADPYMYRQPMRVRSEREWEFCRDFNDNVRFASWDMIAGKKDPELGGDPKYLQILGMNYYFYNQQMVGINGEDERQFAFRSLSLTHKRRLPLSTIIGELSARYGAPVLITETGSYRKRRPLWWKYILDEAKKVLQEGFPLIGICAYPTLDIVRGAGFIVPQSGIFDFDQKDPTCQRIPHRETLDVIVKELRDLVPFRNTGSDLKAHAQHTQDTSVHLSHFAAAEFQ